MPTAPSSDGKSGSDHDYGTRMRGSEGLIPPHPGPAGSQHITPSPSTSGLPTAGRSRHVFVTPGSSRPPSQLSSSGGGNKSLLVPVKSDARRRLVLDSNPVDPEGFKTPIKTPKRKADFSSPSPVKKGEEQWYSC